MYLRAIPQARKQSLESNRIPFVSLKKKLALEDEFQETKRLPCSGSLF
jgi:hypothetical protein